MIEGVPKEFLQTPSATSLLVPLTYGDILFSLSRLIFQFGTTNDWKYIKFLPEVRGGAQRADGSVIMSQLLYFSLKKMFFSGFTK